MHSYESCYGSILCRKTHVAFRPQHLPSSFWKIPEQTPHERQGSKIDIVRFSCRMGVTQWWRGTRSIHHLPTCGWR